MNHALTNDCIGGGCDECERDAEAPAPDHPEAGADSAIAIHSDGGISGPPPIDPTVEAAGAAPPVYDPVEARRRIRVLAEARLQNRMDGRYWGKFLDAAFAVADLMPIAECPACERLFVPHDGRQKTYCSVRCQQRVTKREQRARKSLLCDPSRAIHVTPHTPESGCGTRAVSPVTASRTDAK